MRIAMFLPVVTRWWLENMIAPLLARLQHAAAIDVVIPTRWSSTGEDPRSSTACANLSEVRWTLLDGASYASLRQPGGLTADVLDLLAALKPDLVLCRSADFALHRVLPGATRYVMEQALPPLPISMTTLTFTADAPFDYGLVPPLTAEMGDFLDRQVAPLLDRVDTASRAGALDRHAWTREMGLSSEASIYLVVLNYEHEENFFTHHCVWGRNADLVRLLGDRLPRSAIVLLQDHPLNPPQARERLKSAAAEIPQSTVLVASARVNSLVPQAMALADGVVLGDTKTITLAAFLGKPVARLSSFQSARWLRHYDNVTEMVEAVEAGAAAVADRTSLRRWIAYALANDALDAADLPAAEVLVERMMIPHAPHLWSALLPPALDRARAFTERHIRSSRTSMPDPPS